MKPIFDGPEKFISYENLKSNLKNRGLISINSLKTFFFLGENHQNKIKTYWRKKSAKKLGES